MVSALDPGWSGPDSSPGRGHCVLFLGKILKAWFSLATQAQAQATYADADAVLNVLICLK